MLFTIYEGKPKYILLDSMFGDILKDVTIGANVNVIIDLKQVYRKMFRNSIELSDTSKEYLVMETERITSDIIGLISHYRNYFYKRGKYSRFYFIYSENECEYMKRIDPNYKSDYYAKYFNNEENAEKIKLLKKCNKALKVMIGLIPNAYYIESSDYDELSYMKYAIENFAKSDLSIILSNDENLYQLVTKKNVYCLTMSGPDSKLIGKNNLYRALDVTEDLNPGLFPVLLAVSGNSRYSIPGIGGFGFRRGAKFLKRLIDQNKIQNTDYVIFPIQSEDLPDGKYEVATRNFEVFTCDKITAEHRYELSTKFVTPKKVVNYEQLNDINNEVFRNFPLDLIGLVKGELV